MIKDRAERDQQTVSSDSIKYGDKVNSDHHKLNCTSAFAFVKFNVLNPDEQRTCALKGGISAEPNGGLVNDKSIPTHDFLLELFCTSITGN